MIRPVSDREESKRGKKKRGRDSTLEVVCVRSELSCDLNAGGRMRRRIGSCEVWRDDRAPACRSFQLNAAMRGVTGESSEPLGRDKKRST